VLSPGNVGLGGFVWNLPDLIVSSGIRRTRYLFLKKDRSFLSEGLESGYLTTLYSCDDCQRRVPISCVRRQASDP